MEKKLSPSATLSHYRIAAKIGAGGMGEVYLAEGSLASVTLAIQLSEGLYQHHVTWLGFISPCAHKAG